MTASQPPSGGCVLKQFLKGIKEALPHPAAFRRLCVETLTKARRMYKWWAPAAFRRLCVETIRSKLQKKNGTTQPPSGGCVLKHRAMLYPIFSQAPSRLQAAVC